MPGELISNVPIFYFPQKSGKQTIKLDSLHIKIPANGIYIGLQYVMNEAYEWKQSFWHKDSTGTKIIDSIVYRYGALIQGLRSKDFELVWYNGIKNEWLILEQRPTSSDIFHNSLKCEATIKYCDN